MEALREPGMIHVKAMCIISYAGKMLATKGFDEVKNQAFFRLIGGGVHYCEKAEDALKREIQEELETELENIKFLKVVQNIFTYKGEPGHEIIFLYSGDLVRKELYEKEEIPIVDHPSTLAVWVPIADVLSKKAFLTPEADYGALL